MTLRNEKLNDYLNDLGWEHPSDIVADLIKGGFIEADEPVLTIPEQYAKAAREWIGAQINSKPFHYASGWSTEGWAWVLGKDFKDIEHDIKFMKNVFAATVLLAKQDGIEL